MKVISIVVLAAALVASASMNSIEAKPLVSKPHQGENVDENGEPWKFKSSLKSKAAALEPEVDIVALQNQTGLIFGKGGDAKAILAENPAADADGIDEDEVFSEEVGDKPRNLRGEDDERKLNVFLPDNRVDVDETAYPYRAVGKFGGCTAEMIYSNIIITNAHCLDYNADGTLAVSTWSKTFYAGFNNGAFLASSTPRRLIYNTGYDFAVIQLQKPLNVGWFGQTFYSQSYFIINRQVSMISYSGDHCTAWNNCRAKLTGCWTRGLAASYSGVRHSCDATRGSSGSGMFTGSLSAPYMVLLNHAEDRNGGETSLTLGEFGYITNPNYAKPAAVWYDAWNKIRAYGTN